MAKIIEMVSVNICYLEENKKKKKSTWYGKLAKSWSERVENQTDENALPLK